MSSSKLTRIFIYITREHRSIVLIHCNLAPGYGLGLLDSHLMCVVICDTENFVIFLYILWFNLLFKVLLWHLVVNL